MKRRYIYRKASNAPSPSLETLLKACGRELLTTWEVLRDKALIDKHLSQLDARYGANAEAKVRAYMHEIKKHERNG
jgi:DNA-binding phage protein